MISTKKSNEIAIAGRTTGLINNGESVTWQAWHLFRTRQFQSGITSMEIPVSFTDEMISGDFESFRHEHYFMKIDNGTIMIDKLFFEAPYGRIGRIVNKLFLKFYLEKLIVQRNNIIREYSETNLWQSVLKV